MNVYVINRADRPLRFAHTVEQLRRVNLHRNITRIEAVSPKEAEANRFEWVTERAAQNIKRGGVRTDIVPTWAAVACARSHMRCWRRAIDSQMHPLTLIVEDDIEFTDPDRFRYMLNKARIAIEMNVDSYHENDHKKPLMWLFDSTEKAEVRRMDDDVNRVIGAFRGLHCYLCNTFALDYLGHYIRLVDSQLEFHIQDLIRDSNYITTLNLYNIPNAGITPSNRFSTDIQPVTPSIHSLHRLLDSSLPDRARHSVYEYLQDSTGEPKPKSTDDRNAYGLYGGESPDLQTLSMYITNYSQWK